MTVVRLSVCALEVPRVPGLLHEQERAAQSEQRLVQREAMLERLVATRLVSVTATRQGPATAAGDIAGAP